MSRWTHSGGGGSDGQTCGVKQAGDVTGLLQAWMRGDPDALAELASLVHYELRQMAKRMLAGERAAYAWQQTDLINESYPSGGNCREK